MKNPMHTNKPGNVVARPERRVLCLTGRWPDAVLPLVLAAACAAPAAAVEAPALASDTDTATAGYFRVEWEAGGAPVRLQEAPGPDFARAETLYEGRDGARVLSGRPDGVSYFRVAALEGGTPGPWSETVKVAVDHHPLSRALLFFGLGGVVFLATLGLIIHGARRDEA